MSYLKNEPHISYFFLRHLKKRIPSLNVQEWYKKFTKDPDALGKFLAKTPGRMDEYLAYVAKSKSELYKQHPKDYSGWKQARYGAPKTRKTAPKSSEAKDGGHVVLVGAPKSTGNFAKDAHSWGKEHGIPPQDRLAKYSEFLKAGGARKPSERKAAVGGDWEQMGGDPAAWEQWNKERSRRQKASSERKPSERIPAITPAGWEPDFPGEEEKSGFWDQDKPAGWMWDDKFLSDSDNLKVLAKKLPHRYENIHNQIKKITRTARINRKKEVEKLRNMLENEYSLNPVFPSFDSGRNLWGWKNGAIIASSAATTYMLDAMISGRVMQSPTFQSAMSKITNQTARKVVETIVPYGFLWMSATTVFNGIGDGMVWVGDKIGISENRLGVLRDSRNSVKVGVAAYSILALISSLWRKLGVVKPDKATVVTVPKSLPVQNDYMTVPQHGVGNYSNLLPSGEQVNIAIRGRKYSRGIGEYATVPNGQNGSQIGSYIADAIGKSSSGLALNARRQFNVNRGSKFSGSKF